MENRLKIELTTPVELLAKAFYSRIPINGKRLKIRRYKTSDIDSYYEVASNLEVSKYMPCEPLRSRELAKNFIESAIRGYRMHSHTKFAIARKDTNEFIGSIAIYDHGIYGLELGYWLSPKYWGMGCATEAISLTLQIVKDIAPDRRIYMDIAKDNEASIKLAYKFGFVATQESSRADIPIYKFELIN